jgi:subtilisin family serine protease
VRRLPLLATVFTLALPASALAQDEIVVLAPGADQSVATETAQREQRLGFTAEHQYERVIDGFAADLTDAQVAALKADPEVAMVVPNRPVSASGIVSAADPARVAPGIRRVTRTAPGTVRESADGAVAVLDTGVDLDHPDLNVAAGANCISPAAAPDDVHGHGTHVAGVIGARNNTTGSTGVAPGTKIYAVKVLDDTGNGSTATILCGAEWVLANATTRSITVANLSLGGPGGPSTCANDPQHQVFCKLATARITPVVAAGNAGTDFGASATYEVPAAYPQVLTVTAMTDTDGQPGGNGANDACTGTPDERYASFSNFTTRAADEAHLVAAPGVCIRSTVPGGGTTRMSGTSMAAPHVAGLVALCKGEGGVAGPCAGLTTPQVIARMRVQSTWSAFAGTSGRLFGPVATVSEAATSTPPPAPVVEERVPPAAPTTTPAPAPAEQPQPAPGPAPAPAPIVVPPATAIVASRPSLTLVTPRLDTLRRRGLTARLGCVGTCAGMIRLRVSKATARRLRLKSTVLATAWPDGPGTVTLRLGRTTRARLAKVRSAFRVELFAEIELESRTVWSAKTLTIRR